MCLAKRYHKDQFLAPFSFLSNGHLPGPKKVYLNQIQVQGNLGHNSSSRQILSSYFEVGTQLRGNCADVTGSRLQSSKAKVPSCPQGWRNLSHIHTPTVRNVDQSEGPKCWTHSPHFPNHFLSKVMSGRRTWARFTTQTISVT